MAEGSSFSFSLGYPQSYNIYVLKFLISSCCDFKAKFFGLDMFYHFNNKGLWVAILSPCAATNEFENFVAHVPFYPPLMNLSLSKSKSK